MTLPAPLPAPLSSRLADPDADTTTHTLPNGVRVVAIELPHVRSASVSVFVRTGSRDESPALNGISHVAEHMAFKGTASRDARQINLDAERLGAEVDAHTDKDHTAYHLRGLAEHVLPFIAMLGDIVLHSSFPEHELEQERQVILQELLEDEDDPMSTAFKLFDKACYGTQPLAQPVIGLRRNIERMTRADLAGYVQRQYTGSNVVVGVAGPIDVPAVVGAVAAAFGAMPAGRENRGEAPAYLGGTRALRMAGSNQSHWVLGFPVPAQGDDDPAAAQVAAALFGEGMSSPLMHEIRERRGLVYYAACSADMGDLSGQFVIEASTTAEHLDACFDQVTRLLREQARAIDAADLQRSRNQIAVRRLRSLERPYLRLEEAAQDLFTLGRVRSAGERRLQIDAVSAGRVQQVFEGMLAERPAVALVGRLGKWSTPRLAARFGVALK